jgi:hypothetical protein
MHTSALSRSKHMQPSSGNGAEVADFDAAENVANDKKKAEGVVSWLSLYQGADSADVLAIVLGALGAVVNGLVFPAFTFAFGEVRYRLFITQGDMRHHNYWSFLIPHETSSVTGFHSITLGMLC